MEELIMIYWFSKCLNAELLNSYHLVVNSNYWPLFKTRTSNILLREKVKCQRKSPEFLLFWIEWFWLHFPYLDILLVSSVFLMNICAHSEWWIFLKISTDVDTQVTKAQTSKNPALELRNWDLSMKKCKPEKSLISHFT